MALSFIIILMVLGLGTYAMYKIYIKLFRDSDVNSALDKAQITHEQAEKAKLVDIRQYQRDKKIVDRIKDLD